MKLAGGVGTMLWDVGGVRITRVVELVMAFPVDFFAEATDLRIVVDTCSGNSKDRPLIPEFNQQHPPPSRTWRRPDSLLRQSISSSAPTCTSITWGGTLGSGGGDECTRARDPFHWHRRWPH
jgi:hypothetical protein